MLREKERLFKEQEEEGRREKNEQTMQGHIS